MANVSPGNYIAGVTDAAYLTGRFLVAMPGIGDPRFDRAVIAMCGHDEHGALGIGLGATIAGLSFHDLLDQFDIAPGDAPDVPVHFGGPCEMRRGFVVHTIDWSGQDTIQVADRFALSGTIDVLRAIAAGSGPSRWVVALGYAGWGGGQLDGELARPGWLTVPGDDTLLFDTPANERWDASLTGAGIDPRLLSGNLGQA